MHTKADQITIKEFKVGVKVFQITSRSFTVRNIKENKYASLHKHCPRKFASRHESRKHSVKDGKVTKISGGLRNSSRNKSVERNAKEPRLLTPSYIHEEPKSQSVANVEETKPSKDKSMDQSYVEALTQSERYNELSPLMTTMVEDELKNIMIKVWQTLPDDAPNEAERLVVKKFKNATGDDLRNTIGLNVTKRLLNVHSGILVKATIPSLVTTSEVHAFAKKYRISKFKNVTKRLYAGRMDSWTDLDELYTHSNPRCGKSFVKVAPIYNFMKCPLNLRTIFDGKQNYSNAKEIEIEAAKSKKSDGKTIITADKVLAKEANKGIAKKDKVPDTKKVDVKTETKKIESKKDNSSKNIKDNKAPDAKKVELKAEPRKTEPKKDSSKDRVPDAKKIVVKDEPKKTESTKKGVTEVAKNTNEKAVDKKTTVYKQSQPAKKEDITTLNSNETKPEKKIIKVDTTKVVDNKPANKTSAVKKVIEAEPQATKPVVKTITIEETKAPVKESTKPVTNKPTTTTNSAKKETITPKLSEVKNPEIKETKVEPPKTVPNKAAKTSTLKKEAVTSKPAEIKKPDTKSTKVVPKTDSKESPKALVKSSKNTKDDTKAKNYENDFDELNDHDILALLSGGIILDECSGSDED